MNKLKEIIENNLYIIKMVLKYTPTYIVGMIAESIIWGVIHSVTSVVFIKLLFEQLELGESFSHNCYLILIMLIFLLLSYLFNVWYLHIYHPKIKQVLKSRMQIDLFYKAENIDFICYDNPTFYNEFIWIMQEADTRAANIIDDIGKVLNRIISLFTISTIIFTIDKTIFSIIIICIIIPIVIRLKKVKLVYSNAKDIKPYERRIDYIGQCFYSSEYAKDIRMSEISGVLKRELTKNIQRQQELSKKYGKSKLKLEIYKNFSNNILRGAGVLGVLIYNLDLKTINLGDFAASYSGIGKLYWVINTLTDYIINFAEHSLYVNRIKEFLEYENITYEGRLELKKFESLEVKNVSFKYENSKDYVLKDVSLKILRGDKIAIVGYNGAGKTTLIKLLLRLYNPTSGSILLNGIDISKYSLKKYREKIGVLFQDFKIFEATLAENVLMDIYDETKEKEVIKGLQWAGFYNIDYFPKGIQTHIGREFDKEGINLSGGEKQKVALARLYKQSNQLMIMDEPSSALDPISEYKFNQEIYKIEKDKTIIFISHRFTTTIMADNIYMFEDGKIIECGSHSKLLEQNGKYAFMFHTQTKRYTK